MGKIIVPYKKGRLIKSTDLFVKPSIEGVA